MPGGQQTLAYSLSVPHTQLLLKEIFHSQLFRRDNDNRRPATPTRYVDMLNPPDGFDEEERFYCECDENGIVWIIVEVVTRSLKWKKKKLMGDFFLLL